MGPALACPSSEGMDREAPSPAQVLLRGPLHGLGSLHGSGPQYWQVSDCENPARALSFRDGCMGEGRGLRTQPWANGGRPGRVAKAGGSPRGTGSEEQVLARGSARACPLRHSCPAALVGAQAPACPRPPSPPPPSELPERPPWWPLPCGPRCPCQLWQCGWGQHCPWSGSFLKAACEGRVCTCLTTSPGWASRVPSEPSLSPGGHPPRRAVSTAAGQWEGAGQAQAGAQWGARAVRSRA